MELVIYLVSSKIIILLRQLDLTGSLGSYRPASFDALDLSLLPNFWRFWLLVDNRTASSSRASDMLKNSSTSRTFGPVHRSAQSLCS
eukprot:3879932-Amphidinium_carterae.1